MSISLKSRFLIFSHVPVPGFCFAEIQRESGVYRVLLGGLHRRRGVARGELAQRKRDAPGRRLDLPARCGAHVCAAGGCGVAREFRLLRRRVLQSAGASSGQTGNRAHPPDAITRSGDEVRAPGQWADGMQHVVLSGQRSAHADAGGVYFARGDDRVRAWHNASPGARYGR